MLIGKQMKTYTVRWSGEDMIGSCFITANTVREVYKKFAMVYGISAKIISLKVAL
jgi:hypothetical protein